MMKAVTSPIMVPKFMPSTKRCGKYHVASDYFIIGNPTRAAFFSPGVKMYISLGSDIS